MHNIQASMEDSLNTLLHGDDTEMVIFVFVSLFNKYIVLYIQMYLITLLCYFYCISHMQSTIFDLACKC